MNKKVLKILIATLVLLIGIGAVSALESNSTDVAVSSQQDDLVAVNNDEVLAVENESSADAVLAVESDDAGDEVLATDNADGNVLAAENDKDSVVAVSNDGNALKAKKDSKLSVSSESKILGASKGKTYYKTLTLGKQVIPKKYYKFLDGSKPSKSNTKLWKSYVAYQKYTKASLAKLKKQASRVQLKAFLNGWSMMDGTLNYSYKITSKYAIIRYYAKFSKTV